MIAVRRMAPNMVMFTDIDSDTGFHIEHQKNQFLRLVHNEVLGLDQDQCERLYWLMSEYRHVFIDDGHLFRKKRVKGDEHTYYKLPTTKFTPEQEMERELDSHLSRIDGLDDTESQTTEIVGIRTDR